MGKAVGGASAVGCGIFGVGSVLIGVALTVWLGSMALSGSTGGNDGDRPAPTTTSTTLPPLPAEAVLAVDPADGSTDGGQVTITGSGFEPGHLIVTTCLTHAPGPLGERCDEATNAGVDAAADGTWTVAYTTRRMITVGSTAYDCAASPGACSVIAHLAEGNDGAGAPFAFTTDLAPIDAVTPPTG